MSLKKKFIVLFCSYVVLGASFKVMTLIDGFTEVRPVNAIPIVAGFLAGPVGALACALGNVVADMFGSFNTTSILGLVANFIAAYLPYKLWYVWRDEIPHVHTYRNMLLFVFLSALSAMTIGWLLAFGLDVFWNIWNVNIYKYVFYNNAGFSIALGMPLFIVALSGEFNIACMPAPHFACPDRGHSFRRIACILYTLCMIIIFIGVYNGMHVRNSLTMTSLSGASVLLLAYLLV